MSNLMQKISQVMEKMAAHPDQILDVYKNLNEYYFRFGEHSFSIAQRRDESTGKYCFYVYPNVAMSSAELANNFENDDPSDIAFASYLSKGLPEEPFSILYSIVEAKALGIENILDDVLGDAFE